MSKILITNNGTHSAEKWAMTTAETIFPLDDTAMIGERLIAAQKFQTQLAELLSTHHGSVIEDEKENLNDPNHYSKPLDATGYVDHVLDEVVVESEGTPWADHFAKPEVQHAVRVVIENHFLTAQHVERLHHADHNVSDEGKAYHARTHQGMVPAVMATE